MPDAGDTKIEAQPRDFSTLAITRFTQDVALKTLRGLAKLPKLPERQLRQAVFSQRR